jgi:cytochrome c556
MPRATITAAAVAAALFGDATSAVADTAPEDAKDYRTAVMTSLRGHVAAASMHVRGLVDGREFLQKHADGLANGASELRYLFPEGSAVDDSEALPVIWEEPDDFAEAVEKAEQATAAFRESVASGDTDAIQSAFREVGMACRGCHDRFRRDED